MMKKRIEAGEKLTGRTWRADTVQLFLYNAAIWNPHRIHYDLPYTQEAEGHPQLLIDGPLQGDWLTQMVYEWLGEDGTLRAFSYSNRRAAYVGDVLSTMGEVTAVDGDTVTLDLRITNQRGEATTVGNATVVIESGH